VAEKDIDLANFAISGIDGTDDDGCGNEAGYLCYDLTP